MPQVHNIGHNRYMHLMQYPTRKFPLTEPGSTQEIEPPYRKGQGRVFRIPLSTTAVVIGRWMDHKDEQDALEDAIGMRELGEYVPQ